jgi:translocation protein SEC62
MSSSTDEDRQAPPPPAPEALAVADFLKNTSQLKARTCIVQGVRKDLFKVKRALRALQSEEYQKACVKNSLLPKVTDTQSAVRAFALLPRSLLALRVSKVEPSDSGKSAKRIKGQWNVKVEPQQEIRDELYYAFFYEPKTWTQTLSAIGLVVALLMVVMFPLWPPMLRLGVWYLSIGMLGLVGLFLVMSVFRLILFVVTMVAVPPGLWLYPNLFEDVGFFDSFRPLWAWHKVKKPKARKDKAVAVFGTKVESMSIAESSTTIPPKPTVEEGDD